MTAPLPRPSRLVQLIEQGRRDRVAVFATYLPSHFPYSLMGCTAGSQEWVPHVDPCDWGGAWGTPRCPWGPVGRAPAPQGWRGAPAKMLQRECTWSPLLALLAPTLPSAHCPPPHCAAVLYLHPICALGAAVKEGIIREAGFWFMDSRDGDLRVKVLQGGRQAGSCGRAGEAGRTGERASCAVLGWCRRADCALPSPAPLSPRLPSSAGREERRARLPPAALAAARGRGSPLRLPLLRPGPGARAAAGGGAGAARRRQRGGGPAPAAAVCGQGVQWQGRGAAAAGAAAAATTIVAACNACNSSYRFSHTLPFGSKRYPRWLNLTSIGIGSTGQSGPGCRHLRAWAAGARVAQSGEIERWVAIALIALHVCCVLSESPAGQHTAPSCASSTERRAPARWPPLPHPRAC